MMILELLLNIQMICRMFIEILKNTIQEKKHISLSFCDDMIADIVNGSGQIVQ